MVGQTPTQNTDRAVLAIELGASSVKLIKINKVESKFEIVRADQIRISETEDVHQEEKLLKDAIHALLKDEQISEQQILVSINNSHTCFGRFVIPKIPHKEINEILKWKMQELISFDLQDAVLDYRLIEIPGTAKEPRFVALTSATPREVINKYSRILMEAGIAQFIPAFSVFSIDSIASLHPSADNGLIAVLDLGHSMSELAFYDNGKLSFLRKLSFGSRNLSRLLTQSLVGERGKISLSEDEAVEVLEKENLFNTQSSPLVAGKVERSKLFALIRPELEKLTSEIERSIDFFSQEHAKTVNSVLIGGGLSKMEGLSEFLMHALEMQVQIIEPLQYAQFGHDLPERNWSTFFRLINSVLDRKEMFQPESTFLDVRAQRIINKLSYSRVALVCGVIMALLVGGLSLREVSFRSRIEHIRAQIQNLKPGFEFSQKIRSLELQIGNASGIVGSLGKDQLRWGEIFSELSYVIPREVLITETNYQDGALMVKGKIHGDNSQTILSNTIVSAQGPVFKRVTLVSVEQKPESKESFFTLRCEL